MQDDKVYVNKEESHRYALYMFKLLCILYTNKEIIKTKLLYHDRHK